MTTLGDIYDYIDSFAPYCSQLDYDNSGLLVGSRSSEVRVAGVVLDATAAAVGIAAGFGCDTLITHHPIMFHKINRLTPDSPEFMLVKNGINMLCAHTNLDLSPEGVNRALAEAIGLGEPVFGQLECGCLCELDEPVMPLSLAGTVKNALGCERVMLMDGGRSIRKIAVIGGCGEDYFRDALAVGAQAVITGEAGYHYLLDAKDAGLTVICAGHCATESTALEPLRRRLSARFPDVRFLALGQQEPVAFI